MKRGESKTWISKKKWNEINKKSELIMEAYSEGVQVFPREGIQIFTSYANNEMCLKELRICVSVHDWYLLQKEPFFQELVEYVERLER